MNLYTYQDKLASIHVANVHNTSKHKDVIHDAYKMNRGQKEERAWHCLDYVYQWNGILIEPNEIYIEKQGTYLVESFDQ